MEHSSHSHPLPHGQDGSLRPSARPSHAPPFRPSSTSQGTEDGQLTPQSRRLQLRNVRFNGASLPIRRISPLFGLASGSTENFNRSKDNETALLSAEKRDLYGENLPPNPVNILQEIQNSARKRASPRPGAGTIFLQDRQSMDENTKPVDGDETSWYNERSTECSPANVRGSTTAMGLREGSLNQRSQPPLNSPLAKQTTSKNMAHLHLRSDSVEQSRYIEHLESQLASAQAKIDSLTSPKTNKMRAVKLRSLTVENRNLRNEIAGWEKKAEEMVEEERLRNADLESKFKSQRQALEEDIEVKDARIAEFEWELESMRVQVRDAEGLEEANANLEKKIDMLSNLLVHSPNKTGSRSAATSPQKTSAQFFSFKQTSRPISMLSRIPSSPGARMSMASESETAFWDSRSRSESIAETPEGSSPLGLHDESAYSPVSDDCVRSSNSSMKRLSYPEAYNDTRNSMSFGTRNGPSHSRPTSFMSTSSMGSLSWGIPNVPDGESKFSNRQRKMRKFPSGSNTLKPLILPVATTPTMQSLPTSAPVYPSIEAVAKRDTSDSSSIDPTTSFLTRLVDSSPCSTPTAPLRQRSTTFVRKQTLNALEGKHRNAGAEEMEIDEETCVASGSSPEVDSLCSGFQRLRRSGPKSLQKELEQAEIEQAHANPLGISALDTFEDESMPPASGSSSYQTLMRLQQRNITPRARPHFIGNNSRTPAILEAETGDNTLTHPIPDHPQSLFTRITNLVTQTKQDPFILARRILDNAWTLGSASMGGMGWWLIGPLHHHQQRHRLLDGCNADHAQENQGSACDSAHWQHFSAEIRNGRLVDGPNLVRDHGSTWKVPPHPHSHENCNFVPPYVPAGVERTEPHLFPCDECVEPSSRRTLRMWFQFSLTIVLAVGLAVKYGPGILLAELSNGHTPMCPRLQSQRIQQEWQRDQGQQRHERQISHANSDEKFGVGTVTGGKEPFRRAHSRDGADSGYGSIAFAEPLGPADFEAG